MAVLSRPLPRLTRCGFSVCTFSPLPVSIRSRGLFCRRRGRDAHHPHACSLLPCTAHLARCRERCPAQLCACRTAQQQDAGAEGSIPPVLPAPGSRGELLWEQKISMAWAASKRIRDASHLAQWALLPIP